MDRYAIHCTEVQTKKALELGVPLQRYTSIPNFADVIEITTSEYYEILTAEQMIEWLEENGIGCIDVYTIMNSNHRYWGFDIYDNDCNELIGDANLYQNRKEATLAAIDSTLDYLISKNKQFLNSKQQLIMKKHFEFVSYDGEYPNLCDGELILKDEDGVVYRFINCWNNCCPENNIYPSFWKSGGCICKNDDWDMWAEEGPWEFYDWTDNYPDFIKENKDELMKVFNENVPYGCCGGCI